MFQLPELPYEYDALVPHIDERTMKVHHTKHHQGYTDKLNKALDAEDLDETPSIEEILKRVSQYPNSIRNNGGGYYNHKLFWEIIAPPSEANPSDILNEALTDAFGSLDNFKAKFKESALGQFGSGWAWLAVNNNGKLFITSTPNQDNPLMDVSKAKGTPILGIDVWEHAYYLNYQNDRGAYIDSFFNIINWDVVSQKYEDIKQGH